MKRLVTAALASAFFAAAVSAQFTVNQYTFAQYQNTYVPLNGAVNVTPTSWDDSATTVSIGFPFVYNGTAYNQVRFGTNGWIQFGTAGTSGTNYTPISAATTTANANHFAAFGRDLQGIAGTSSMSYLLRGSPGSQVFTLQWAAFRRYPATTNAADNYNFQINLLEATNEIEVVYGGMTTGATALTCQVGMRGAANTDFNNRSVVAPTPWINSVAGAANTATCAISPTSLPVAGDTYRWTPPPTTFLTVAGGASPTSVLSGNVTVLTAQVGIYPSGTPFSGAAATVNFSAVGGPAAQPMYDDGTNGDPIPGDNIFSYAITLTSTVAGTAAFPITATAAGGLSATSTINIEIYTQANDVPAGALPVTIGVNGPFDTANTLVNPSYPLCVGGSRDLWFAWLAPCTGTASFSTCEGAATTSAGYLNDTILAVRNTAYVSLACNDDGGTASGPGGANICGTSGYQSTVSGFAVTAGTTYLIQVAGYGTASTPGLFKLTVNFTSAQATSSGAGCAATGGNALTLTSGLPVLGSNFTVDASGANAFDGAILAFDVAGSVVINIGCDLYLDPFTAQLIVAGYDALGGISVPVSLPYVPALCGASFDLQAFCLPAAGGFGTSNKRTLVFGL